MEERLILDLCGGTGSWSEPYRRAGYDVFVVDSGYRKDGYITETVEEFCKRDLGKGVVHGILAAPPCTEFSSSGAVWWKEKEIANPRYLEKALGTVFACLEVVKKVEPVWWCLENPVGRLSRFLGKPRMYFDPCDFGDAYTKKTCLWGEFNTPAKTLVEADRTEDRHNNPKDFFERVDPKLGALIASMRLSRDKVRSITPLGFAQAFFRANP